MNSKIILSVKELGKINEIESYLYNYKSILAAIENLKKELISVKEYDLPGISSEGTSKTNKFSSTVESSLQKVQMLEYRIRYMENKISQLNRALESLSDIEREIITNFYIERKRYFEFTNKVYRSERTCKRIKGEAITKIMIAMYGLSTI